MDILKQRVLSLDIPGCSWGASTTKEVGYGVNELIIVASLEKGFSMEKILDNISSLQDEEGNELVCNVTIDLWNIPDQISS